MFLIISEKSKEFLIQGLGEAPMRDDSIGIYDYPTLTRLFEAGETARLENLRAEFENTKRKLDHIVRHGNSEEAVSASKALTAISITLEFIDSLEAGRD